MAAPAVGTMNPRDPIIEARLRLRLSEQPEIVSVDDGVEELLGYTAGDFRSSRVSLLERIHAEDRACLTALFSVQQLKRTGSLCLRIRHADGRIRCVQVGFDVAWFRRETMLDLVLTDARCISRPLTEQLGGSHVRALLENTNDVIFFKDRNHVFTAASRSMTELLRPILGERDLIGITDYDMLSEEEADAFYRPEKAVLTQVEFSHDIQRFSLPDGQVLWMDDRKYRVEAENGEVTGLFAIARDITERVRFEEELKQSKELMQLFVERAPAALAMFDREMRYVAASARWLQDYGIPGMDVIGRSHYEVFPEVPERWKEVHRRGFAGESIRNDEDRFERADGSVQWVRWEMIPWRRGDGSVGGILIFAEDITEAKQVEERLKLAANVFKNASEAIVITDLAGAVVDVNDAFTRVTGFTREDILGRNPRTWKSGLHGKTFYEDLWRTLAESGHWRGELWNRRKDGDLFASSSTISTVYDAAGRPQNYVAVFSDITRIKDQERKLAQLAHFDALTGLANRAQLTEQLRQAMEASAPERMLAVAYFDLDDFKGLNDRHGKEKGDALLTAIAGRMKHAMRPGDILARISGDEFVAVLRDLEDADDAEPMLVALNHAASEPVEIDELELKISVSAGVVLYPQGEDVDADQLLRQANHAMYQAKLAGKNRYHFFDVTQDETLRIHHGDIESFRHALASQELVLYYQPKVNMAKGTVVGAEALLRWQHPQWGLLLPGLFLPVVENHSLVVELGEWVIEGVLKQMESWRAQGLDLPVSLNLSARSLQNPEFVERLQQMLAAHPQIDPSRLELEVLETSALLDVAQVSELIGECRKVGVSVAIDDFGTGYSSLTYLKRLPANVLKIDQSFVRNMVNDPGDLAILEGVLGLATAFRRQAIAEGVETVEQGQFLLHMGCELAQGFGIAWPMPGSEFPGWAARWQPDPSWKTVRPLSSANWPWLYAGVEHRAWVRQIDAYLREEWELPPGLGATQCRLGTWLEAEMPGARGSMGGLRGINALHVQAHALADHIMSLKAGGRAADGLERLKDLDSLVDELAGRAKDVMARL